MSIRDAAKEARTSEATARRIAKRLNLGLEIGGKRTGLTAADVATIKENARSGPGNPNMKAGAEHQAKAARKKAEKQQERG